MSHPQPSPLDELVRERFLSMQPFTARDAANGGMAWDRGKKTDLDMIGVFGDDIEHVVHGGKTTDHSAGTRSRDDSGGSSLCRVADRPDRETGSETRVDSPELLVAAQ